MVKGNLSVKALPKNIHWIICTIVLAIILLFTWPTAKTVLPRFCVSNNAGTEEISIYEAEDGNCYVFLPSYAELEQVRVVIPSGQQVALGGVKLSNGMACGEFTPETAYPLEINGRREAMLWFYKSDNVATMYIDTASGSMEHIHQDKSYEENASIVLYTADGEINYCDELITIGGRGNTTWTRPKKPYTITLRQSSQLLNMGTSGEWALITNGYDTTSLRNKIVYGFADSVAPQSAWSPDCSYVEVYLNGEYAGLYLLCQKIDIGPDHLNLDADDYFIELMWAKRALQLPTAFDIYGDRSIDIVGPENCSASQLAELQNHINLFQEALLADDGISHTNGLSWSDYIDMDSWARKYLIEEVFSNFDSGQASQYFWLDASEGKIYAGPCWDYDLTFGTYWGTAWSTPYCMLALRDWGEEVSWYKALCQKDEFMKLVVEIYATEFRPLLQNYADEGIDNIATDVECAVLSDRLRWPSMYSEEDWNTSVEAMVEYLHARMTFLDALWLDNADFCTITFQTEETYNVCVPAGTVGTCLPQPEAFGASGVWYLSDTKVPLDMTLPITTDITVVPLISEKSLTTRESITYASMAVLGFLLLCFAYIDFRQRSKERKCADERGRREISP